MKLWENLEFRAQDDDSASVLPVLEYSSILVLLYTFLLVFCMICEMHDVKQESRY